MTSSKQHALALTPKTISPFGLPLSRKATKMRMKPSTLGAMAINIRARWTYRGHRWLG